MKGRLLTRPQSLTVQIKAMEQQILQRRQAIPLRSDSLTRKIRQRMAAPATLLLAGGIGFLLGELSKHRPATSSGITDKPTAAKTSPLTTALKLMTTARTLYMALPMAWILKSAKQPQQSSEWQKHRMPSVRHQRSI